VTIQATRPQFDPYEDDEEDETEALDAEVKLAVEFVKMKKLRETMEKRERKLKEHLMETIAEVVEPTDDGHCFLEFPFPIEGFRAIKRERRESVVLDADAALDLVNRLGLQETCIRMEPVLDEDALLAANFAGDIPDDDMKALYTRKESFACVPIKE
jgi:hypothetical protein